MLQGQDCNNCRILHTTHQPLTSKHSFYTSLFTSNHFGCVKNEAKIVLPHASLSYSESILPVSCWNPQRRYRHQGILGRSGMLSIGSKEALELPRMLSCRLGRNNSCVYAIHLKHAHPNPGNCCLLVAELLLQTPLTNYSSQVSGKVDSKGKGAPDR